LCSLQPSHVSFPTEQSMVSPGFTCGGGPIDLVYTLQSASPLSALFNRHCRTTVRSLTTGGRYTIRIRFESETKLVKFRLTLLCFEEEKLKTVQL